MIYLPLLVTTPLGLDVLTVAIGKTIPHEHVLLYQTNIETTEASEPTPKQFRRQTTQSVKDDHLHLQPPEVLRVQINLPVRILFWLHLASGLFISSSAGWILRIAAYCEWQVLVAERRFVEG